MRREDMENLLNLIFQGKSSDVNVRDYEGKTLLMYAVEKRDKSLVNKIIEFGAFVNEKNHANRSAIMYAVENRDIEMIDLLIKARADVNSKDNSQETAIMYAIKSGDLAIVNKLIDAGANVNTRNYFNETPLMYATNFNIAMTLLKHGADINAKDNLNKTVLMNIVYQMLHCHNIVEFNECIGVITELIHSGVDINAVDCKGETALISIVYYIKYLTEQLNSSSKHFKMDFSEYSKIASTRYQLVEHALNAFIKTAKLLIEKGANINVATNGVPIFHIFIEENIESLVKLLLKKGVNVNIRDKKGNTPLKKAKNSRNPRIIKMLIESGANYSGDGVSSREIIMFFIKDAKKLLLNKIEELERKEKKISLTRDEIQKIRQIRNRKSWREQVIYYKKDIEFLGQIVTNLRKIAK